MARYFLHIDDGSAMPDRDGSEFTSLADVEAAVRGSLVEMMADASLERRTFSLKIEVRDEAGHLVMGGQVSYALHVMPLFADKAAARHH